MRHDAIVIGGSFAGLSGAIYLARARRTVLVIDAGRPRNRFAAASHGMFGLDGQAPGAMIAAAKAQVDAYPTTTLLSGAAVTARAAPDGFEIGLQDGRVLAAARLVLAFGITDQLPDLPGLADCWGRSVLHCPYCHGFEYAGRRLGVLMTKTLAAHHARLIAQWGPTTLFLNGEEMPTADERAQLAAGGIGIEPARIAAVRHEQGQMRALSFEDGRAVPLDALYLAPAARLASPIAEQLGCAFEETPVGPLIRVDATQQTNVAGVFAAGDIARANGNATWAAADGMLAGVALHRSLVFPPSPS